MSTKQASVSTHGGKRPGAGRPPVYPQGRVTRSLSLDTRADEALTRYMRDRGLSRSQAASELILAEGRGEGQERPRGG